MRNYILVIIVILVFICAGCDEGPAMGCVTGLHQTGGSNDRKYLGCMNEDEFNKKKAEPSGTSFQGFIDLRWRETDKCSDCQ